MSIILETKNLCKFYGAKENEVKAVDNINIAIKEGEFAVIVGKSGSGKSTLLHMLGGLDTPTSGQVLLKGKELYKLKEDELAVFRRRKIGFIFQAFNLVSSINVWENIVLPIGLDGKKVDKEYIKDIVETGSVGFLLLCLFLVSILYEQRKKPLNILICIMVGWFGLFYNVFEVQIVAFLLWGYLGVLNQNKEYER